MQNSIQLKGLQKFKLIFILAFLSAIAPLSIDMYLPALPNVSKSFQASEFYTQLSLTSFFLAFALGQLLYGPLSDIFGRKKPLYIGISLFILSSIGCVLVDSISIFIILRFLEALGGCAGVVIARAIVNDRFDIKDASGVFALMMVVSSLAPMLSPSFGSMLLNFFSWHSIFATLFLCGIILLLLVFFSLEESAPNFKNNITTKHNLATSHTKTLQTYKRILQEKIFMIYVISGSFAMAAMYAYITGSSFVYMNIFGLDKNAYSIVFALNALSFVVCANINAKIVQKIPPQHIISKAFIAMLIFSIILVVAGILNYTSPIESTVSMSWFHWRFLIFEIAMLSTISMLGFILPNLTTLAMARFKDCSGSASAVLGTIQFGMAGIISFLVGAFHANTPIFLACIMFSTVSCGVLLYFSFAKEKWI
ncbi:Bcr/CflA family drug resistance efflux transporter [Helicobacter didelphidarum]|uniref:Bcr/CflA family drug resistance efflux transporter n=1 Tax=Helicobacter didelphidarum TaxID=2040648 RepID=A0A3D8IQI9_9HELI|nr:multidrug effflux MFS transporter [Helicobacter didelphidarum]RDU67166.1 Bcr/CflA family drug resistance efflux transporter [Helicobacter didelphidarum]